MCKDPTNQKFQVKKEDDLQVRFRNISPMNNFYLKAFWDGMVFPSVQVFFDRADWLIESGSLEWSETQKEKNPFKPVLKVQPTNKPKVIKLYSFCLFSFYILATEDKTATRNRSEAERKTESCKRGRDLMSQALRGIYFYLGG